MVRIAGVARGKEMKILTLLFVAFVAGLSKGLDIALPSWELADTEVSTNIVRFNPNWNMVRFTARGAISPQGLFHVRMQPHGFHLILR